VFTGSLVWRYLNSSRRKNKTNIKSVKQQLLLIYIHSNPSIIIFLCDKVCILMIRVPTSTDIYIYIYMYRINNMASNIIQCDVNNIKK